MPQKSAQRPNEAAVVGFAGFVVSRLLFQELPKMPLSDGEAANTLATNIVVGYGMNDAGDRSEVRFNLSIRPDPRDKPYQIEVEVVGQFVLKDGTRGAFEQFCRGTGPTILFPYVREVVHRITQDARFGPIRMDPLNVRAMLDRDKWLETESVPKASSNEPSRPSSR